VLRVRAMPAAVGRPFRWRGRAEVKWYAAARRGFNPNGRAK
jgi:hypothetical protein